MNPVASFVAKFRRPAETLTLGSAPLHTETKVSAAQAPAQVEAALKRGSLVCGFTEVHKTLSTRLAEIAAKYGYDWVHGSGDTALAVKSHLHATHDEVPVAGTKTLLSVTFRFNGHKVTVFAMHWATIHSHSLATRKAQTEALIRAMDVASQGSGISFFVGDSNPTKPLSDPSGDPRQALNKAGVVLIYQEVHRWPADIGVNMVGRQSRDRAVKGTGVHVYPALGSDHVPVVATYRVR